jgi:hypothetical protein
MKKTEFNVSPLSYIPGGVRITLNFSDGTFTKTNHSNVKYPASYVKKVMNDLEPGINITEAYAGNTLFFLNGAFVSNVPNTQYNRKGISKVY